MTDLEIAKTGIDGLDLILNDGLPRACVYLIEGVPGTGKTTLSLQFLLEGVRLGEAALYITLSESQRGIEDTAKSHGLSMDGVSIFEYVPTEETLSEDEDYTVFHASDVELGRTTKNLLEAINKVKPQRVVLDSLSDLRLISQSTVRYRRQVLALKQTLTSRGCTSLFIDDDSKQPCEMQMHSIVHGAIRLTKYSPRYGVAHRQLEISKLRGVQFNTGLHDFTIERGGLKVYPRFFPTENITPHKRTVVKSGIAKLDDLLGGGLDSGTSALLLGPIGSGKSVISSCFAAAAAARGEHAAIFTFDESKETLLARSTGLGIPLKDYIDSGLIFIQQIDPAELSPGEFASLVRETVKIHNTKVITIDSLAGYLAAMPEASYLTIQMHELLSYLNHRGVLTILILTQHGLLGNGLDSPVDISYLADTVLLLRYFEAHGQIKKAISVVKKRTGSHETSIREFKLMPGRVEIGNALTNFQGVLEGVPIYVGDPKDLLDGRT